MSGDDPIPASWIIPLDLLEQGPWPDAQDIWPMPRHCHTDSTRKQKRSRCKARRRARLPRRHWVRRARRGER